MRVLTVWLIWREELRGPSCCRAPVVCFNSRFIWASSNFLGCGWARGAAARGWGRRPRSAAAGLAGLAGLGPARGAVRQSVGERGGGGGGGEGRGEGRPLPYMAQAPPPDVTL